MKKPDTGKYAEQVTLLKQRTDEEAAQKLEKSVIAAERRLALAEQKREASREERAQKARRAASQRFYESRKHEHQKVGIARNQILKQFVEEIQGKPLIEADPFNVQMVAKRRQQMSMLKETMELINKLQDLREALIKETPDLAKEKKTDVDKESAALFSFADKFRAKRLANGAEE